MKKFAFGWFVAFVAIALFVGAVPAEAQYGYQNEVGALVQGNLNLVSGLHGQLDRARWESQAHGLVFHNGYYGNYGNDGYFYGQYDREGRRMSRPVKFAIGGAIAGAGLGYGISGNGRGAAIGGVVGGVIGLIAGRDHGQQQQYSPGQGRGQLVPAPMPEQEPAPNMGAEPWPEPQQEKATEMVSVKNCTRYPIDVYDWDSPVGTLQPGESRQFPVATRGGYRGLATIGIVRSWTDSRYQDSTGSILFIEPTGGAR